MIEAIIIIGLFFGNVMQAKDKYDHCVRWEFVDEGCRAFPDGYREAAIKRAERKR